MTRNGNTTGGPLPEELAQDDPGDENVIRANGQTFKSVEELRDAYVSESAHRKALESTIGRQGNELGRLREAAPRDPNEDEDFGIPKERFEKFDSEFVADPNKAMRAFAKDVVKATEDRVTAKVLRQVASHNSVESFWSDYFDAFPNQEPIETYVRVEGNRMVAAGELDGLSRDQQMKAISAKIQALGSQVFGSTKTREVPDTKVVTGARGSGGAAPKGTGRSTTPAEKPMTFMDEVKSTSYRKDPLGV